MSSIVVIDSRVSDYQLLIAGLAAGTKVIVLDAEIDGVEQIAQAMQGSSGVESIHIISHGSQGTLFLGSTALSAENIGSYQNELASIGAALDETGDILLYGCDAGAGEVGQAFIDQLAALTGADVAASTGTTGNAALGGDWVLEASSGFVATTPILSADAQQSYAFVLDEITGTAGADSLTGTSGNDSIHGLAGDDTMIGDTGDDHFDGGAGNDIIDGGYGGDTAHYSGDLAGYRFTLDAEGNLRVADTDTLDGSDGTDALIGVETLVFADLDVDARLERRDVVNTTVEAPHFVPRIATLADGGYVIVWHVRFGQDSDGLGVCAQRFDANGTPIGVETLINTITAGDQAAPDVTALTDGGYVVVWQSGGTNVDTQRFDANGERVGEVTRVTDAAWANEDPYVAGLAGGGYVVSWTPNDGVILARVYDDAGSPLGAVFQVNSASGRGGHVEALADGGFVVGWSNGDIYARRFAADGTPVGVEELVPDSPEYFQNGGNIEALTDGGYLVTWNSWDQDGSGIGVYAQRFDSDGVRVGTEFRINGSTDGDQTGGVTTALVDGGFVVNWNAPDGSGVGTFAQRFSADGARVGGETRIHAASEGNQGNATATSLHDGGYVITYVGQVAPDSENYDIYAKRYTADGRTTSLIGNVENNRLVWSDADSIQLEGDAGDDTLVGGAGADVAYGGDDQDSLAGALGDDLLFGDTGGDTLNGGGGADTMYGGTGEDLYWVDNTEDVVVETTNTPPGPSQGLPLEPYAGVLDVVNSTVNFTLGDYVENLVLRTSTDLAGTGNELDNKITGNSGANVLLGMEGNDTLAGAGGSDSVDGGLNDDSLNGNAGNDTLDGGLGIDTMSGGTGDDTYIVDSVVDLVTESGDTLSGGMDTIKSSVSRTLGSYQEILLLTGTNVINGTGNSLANTLTGNDVANKLTGGAGNDTLLGAAGNDTLVGGTGMDSMTGGAGVDVFDFNSVAESAITASRDTIADFLTGTDKIDLAGLDADINITGNQVFGTLVNGGAFSEVDTFSGANAGAARLYFDQTNQVLYANVDSDAEAEFSVSLVGVAALATANVVM